MFTKCFESDDTINIQFQRWHQRLIKALHTSFIKIKIKDDKKKQSKVDSLIKRKTTLLKKKNLDDKDKAEIDKLNDHIIDECEDMEYKKLTQVVGSIKSECGETNSTNVWKEMEKAFPKKKQKTMPTGVTNIEGKIITNPDEKKRVILDHFKHRMRKRPVKEEIKSLMNYSNNLYKQRFRSAKFVESPAFTIDELEVTLKSLKTGKSRDPENFICDIFKEGVICDDL